MTNIDKKGHNTFSIESYQLIESQRKTSTLLSFRYQSEDVFLCVCVCVGGGERGGGRGVLGVRFISNENILV